MSSPINRKLTGITGTSDWIPLNRWGRDDLSIVTTIDSGTPTYTVEFTLDRINQVGVLGSEVARDVVDAVDLTANANLNITATPMEAVRLNITSGTGSMTFHVMQGGE